MVRLWEDNFVGPLAASIFCLVLSLHLAHGVGVVV